MHGGSAAAPMIGKILRASYGKGGENEKTADQESDESD